MGAKRLGIRVLGWLSLVVGYGLALLLIRGVFIGITKGFGANRSQVFWIVLGYLLFLALAAYLFTLGRRALSLAKGRPQTRMRFGWGRMVLGAILLYSSAVDHFHLIPVHRMVRHLEPTNETQAVAMRVTAIALAVGCVVLILSGIWRGFRPDRNNANA
jgi:hypothetical protein